MAPVTEIAIIPLQAGAEIENPDSPAGNVWQSTIKTISEQGGYQGLYYGLELENQTLLQLLVDWDTLESHQRFIDSATYGSFYKRLTSITDGPIILYHASFNPQPLSLAVGNTAAPVTEMLTAYLDSKDEAYAERSAKFATIIESNAEACKGAMTGWMIEEMEHEGKQGHAYVSLISWESKEKHTEFRETSAFKDNIQMCREGARSTSVNHTIFQRG